MAAFSNRAGVPVYVFRRAGGLTTQAVSAVGDQSMHMRWYWEGRHFKLALGDKMVRHDSRLVIGSDDADRYRAVMRNALAAFRHTHPEAAACVETAYREASN